MGLNNEHAKTKFVCLGEEVTGYELDMLLQRGVLEILDA